ncbi:alpha/beta fold hydrolase [Candidatus Gracilibacteria bacterium]|nr:alpha/beta fold hydrolase [Candidatus Gracilibacteria bacterium]
MTETLLVRQAGCPLYAEIDGPATAPLLVFIHGNTLDHRMFEAQTPAFRGRYRTLRYDVRGHGRSRPLGPHFSIPLCAEDLAALLDTIGASSAILVGQSMGSYIAQEFLLRYPQRVIALVSIGGTAITQRVAAVDRFGLRLTPLLFRIWPYKALQRLTAQRVSIRAEVQRYAFECFQLLPQRDFLAIWGGVATALHYQPDYRITSPLLICYGEHDNLGRIKQLTPPWAARDSAGRYTIIPDAGHNANQDNPVYFNRLLSDFLAETLAGVGNRL